MAIDRTPEEQEEYNRLKKDIIKDIKKEARKKDYNSSNKNTTSSSLTDIIKSRREAGEGVFSSLGGAARERIKEKLDFKRILPQGGLLTALFPKLTAYKAQLLNTQSDESTGVNSAITGSTDSLAPSKPLLDSISVSTKIIAKNSMALPLIQKDTNLMRKTLVRIVKAMQVKKKFVPITKKSPVSVRNILTTQPKTLEPEREKEKKQNPIGDLLKKINEIFNDIGTKLTKILIDLPGKIVSGIVTGFKGLFTGVKIASAFLLSILKPLLSLVFSKAGLALLLAAGIFWSLYKMGKILSEKVAENVPDMKVLSPSQAAAALRQTPNDMIALASDAAGRTARGGEPKNKRFTAEEARAFLIDRVNNGKKYAQAGLDLVNEKNNLESILKSGDKAKIDAAGGKEKLEQQISNLKIRISSLGGEDKFKDILKESDIPKAELDAIVGESVAQGDAKSKEELVAANVKALEIQKNYDDTNAGFAKKIRKDNAVATTRRMDLVGYDQRSKASPSPVPPSDDVGEFQMIPMTPPAKSETDETVEALKENENLISAQDGPGQNQGFFDSNLNQGSIVSRIPSPLNPNHPNNLRLANASIIKLAHGYHGYE
jgi:hypothetical protein